MGAIDISEKTVARGKPFTPDDPRINRTGRPAGSLGKRSTALLELLRPDGERLLQRAVDLALDQKSPDAGTLRDLLGRLLPVQSKSAPVNFDLLEGSNPAEQSFSVLRAISVGDISPEEGQRVLAALASHAEIVTAYAISQRLAVLESRATELSPAQLAALMRAVEFDI